MQKLRVANVWHGLDLNWHPEVAVAVAAVRQWYEAEAGSLVLSGGCGCGKTHIARVILRSVGGPIPVLVEDANGRLATVQNAVFYSEPGLIGAIRSSYDGAGSSEQKLIAGCRAARLLILDDIGVAYVKEESQRWLEDIYWRLFDGRAERNLPTLITTNLTPVELSARLGQRAWSRLQGMLGQPEHFVSMFSVPDYRAKNF